MSNTNREYVLGSLDDEVAGNDPIALFGAWFNDARDAGVPDHNAMALATAGSVSISCRIVLLSSFDADGFVFHTNYNSRKAMDLERDPRVALTFFWPQLERQVRIEGKAEHTSGEESDAYFASRPLERRIASWSSDQSRPVASREMLEERFARWKDRFNGQEIPRPLHWGGVRVRPVRIEFWHGRQDRMHDRIVFEHYADGSWQRMRLQP